MSCFISTVYILSASKLSKFKANICILSSLFIHFAYVKQAEQERVRKEEQERARREELAKQKQAEQERI